MSDVSVVHLVREGNGSAPLRRFLDSYRKHPAGIDHKLVIVFKGFQDGRPDHEITDLLVDVPCQNLSVDDHGFDIGAYFTAARTITSRHICFLNSFSTIFGDNWLLKLYRQITAEGVGMAGATGSWESIYTDNLQIPHSGDLKLRDLLFRWWQLSKFKAWFAPFPNPHLRTNGFIIARELMLQIRHGKIADKMDAHRFESGKSGLSSQIRAMGLKLVLVGRDGHEYLQNDWHLSNTFKLADQSNLLIADNQTELYKNEDIDGKRRLCNQAWGITSCSIGEFI